MKIYRIIEEKRDSVGRHNVERYIFDKSDDKNEHVSINN